MTKIKSSLESIKEDISKFYLPKKWHFLTINALEVDGEIEIQYIFFEYGTVEEVVVFYFLTSFESKIPSITDIIPSAIISQREIVDMFQVEIENSPKGLYLDEDSLQMPLRCKV